MTPIEVTTILQQFNEWRWGDYEPSEQPDPPDPREMGEALDAAIEMIERTHELEIVLREFAWSNDSESRADCARSVVENQSD